MNPELPPGIVARYTPNTSSLIPVILISGLGLLGIVGYRMLSQTPEERLVTLTMMCFLVAGTAVFSIVFSYIKIRAIEVTASGTVDFVSRARRVSHQRSSLLRIEGFTTRGSKGSRTHRTRFIFAGGGQNEINKEVIVPIKPDPDLQEFVRQLELNDTKVDTSSFWAWINQ